MNSSSNEILKYILSNDSQNLTIANIAKGAGKDYKNAHVIIKKLSEMNILKIEKIGSSSIVKPIKYPNPYFFSAEYNRREDILKNKTIKNIFNILKRLYYPRIVLLFGSYVKNTYNKHSDIDLMVISDEKYHEKIERKLNVLPYDIHLAFLTFEEFRELVLKKEFTVVSEAIKQNIILNGIEDYYILLSSTG
jgi:predicted nucleotidyltransferase